MAPNGGVSKIIRVASAEELKCAADCASTIADDSTRKLNKASNQLGSRANADLVGAVPFDVWKVGQIGWNAIRGRRAQRSRPRPRLPDFHPFGVPR